MRDEVLLFWRTASLPLVEEAAEFTKVYAVESFLSVMWRKTCSRRLNEFELVCRGNGLLMFL